MIFFYILVEKSSLVYFINYFGFIGFFQVIFSLWCHFANFFPSTPKTFTRYFPTPFSRACKFGAIWSAGKWSLATTSIGRRRCRNGKSHSHRRSSEICWCWIRDSPRRMITSVRGWSSLLCRIMKVASTLTDHVASIIRRTRWKGSTRASNWWSRRRSVPRTRVKALR